MVSFSARNQLFSTSSLNYFLVVKFNFVSVSLQWYFLVPIPIGSFFSLSLSSLLVLKIFFCCVTAALIIYSVLITT